MVKSQWHYCCYFKHGCQDIFGVQNLEDHQKSCIFREMVCLDNKCKKQILFKDFIDHLDSDHKNLLDNETTKVDGKTFIVSFGQENISQNILKFEAANFTQLTEIAVQSEPIYVQNLPWKIEIKTFVDESVKYLGGFAKCDCKSKSTTWSCQAKYELRMINHESAKKTHFRELDKLFSFDALGWGLRKFKKWNKVIDPAAGFLINDTVTFELKIDSAKGLNLNFPKICDSIGTPTMLKTSGAIFFLASQRRFDTIRFWIYLVGSSFEAKIFSYTLSIRDKTGEQKYVFHGKVFTLDKDDPLKGSVFMMGTEDAKEIYEEKSKFDVIITIRNLKEEAMDDDESSGVSDAGMAEAGGRTLRKRKRN
jgi:hypothetical protein